MLLPLQSTSVVSTIPVSLSSPINYNGGPIHYAIGSDPRSIQPVDLNGDGYLDIFIQPSYYIYAPALSPIVLLNDKKGGFYDGTASIFKIVPTIEFTDGLFFKDFNNDGKVDMFVTDQGIEVGDANVGGFSGAINQLYLQDANGVFQNATIAIPENGKAFNHVSTTVDINNDGNLDVLVTRMGGPKLAGSGVFFYLGDGKGGFTFSIKGLPEEVKYLLNEQHQWGSTTIDYQNPGSAGAADLNNDGLQDLISGSYGNDGVTGQRTVRVFQQSISGDFVMKWQTNQPQALFSLFGSMGVAGVVSGDLDGDGLKDLVVHWETGAKSAIQILKNKGAMQFADVTESWVGSYLPVDALQKDSTGSYQQLNSGEQLRDINHDGYLDLVLNNRGATATQLTTGLPSGAFVYLNDGTGHLSAALPASGADVMSNKAFTDLSGTAEWGIGVPLAFDANRDGISDLVFIDETGNVDQSVMPYKTTALHVSTLFGASSGGIYRASESGEHMIGTAGNDHVFSGTGRDTIDGGNGTDTAIYSSLRNQYSINKTSGTGVTITSKAFTEGVDALYNVERIKFSDVTVNLTVSVNAKSISAPDLKMLEELYVAFFNRVPDADGLNYWIDQLKGGKSFSAIADDFYGAAVQYTALTGYSSSMTNDELVKIIYKNVLGRTGTTAPPSADVNFWSGELASGHASKGSLVRTMLESAHSFKGDATWGWVADLLDNKIIVADYFSIQHGLSYNSAEDSIVKGMAIAAAVTNSDTKEAIRLIGIEDTTSV